MAGVLIGPEIGFRFITDQETIEVISEIGLVLLLFIIGLEMDLKKLRASGKPVIATGVTQFLICVALGAAGGSEAEKNGNKAGISAGIAQNKLVRSKLAPLEKRSDSELSGARQEALIIANRQEPRYSIHYYETDLSTFDG